MTQFHFRAIDHRGSLISGTIDADSASAAVTLLQEKGALPVEISSAERRRPPLATEPSQLFWPRRKSAFPLNDLADWCDQLGGLLRAGLTVDSSLSVIEHGANSAAVRELCHDILVDIKEGTPLSVALEHLTLEFHPILIPLIQAAELTGTLPLVLENLSAEFNQGVRFRDSLRSALTYPAILIATSVISIVIIVTVVLPALGSMFNDMQAPLPLLTRMVLGFGAAVRDWWWLLIVAFAALAGLSVRYFSSIDARTRLDQRLLKARLIGPLMSEILTVRLCRILGLLLENGVTIDRAIPIAMRGIGSRFVVAQLSTVEHDLKIGRSLSGSLEGTTLLAPGSVQMIRVGEEAGALGPMLSKIALRCEKRAMLRLNVLLSIIQPTMILVIAGIIGLIVTSLLLAILSINDLAF